MRAPLKILSVALVLLTFKCGKAQECPAMEIPPENLEPFPEKSYANDEVVKVNCIAGYTGFSKYKCMNGNWKIVTERKCAKKKCNHPGDTMNGEFKIIDGNEFVFGVTVEYKCKPGYEMTSRIFRRTCRSQGWDNSVPICEAVKCPAIHADGDVRVSGKNEEASYGDVVHFECVSSEKKLEGSADIHCTEMGAWSDSVPKCVEITCTEPDIEHRDADKSPKVYKEGEALKYQCKDGHKPREGTPHCTRYGWSIRPECEVILCVFNPTTFGKESVSPLGKTLFKVGEELEITCAEKYWIFTFSTKSKICTCREDGTWDTEPVCQEKRCEVPRISTLYYPEDYFKKTKLGEEVFYYCKSYYTKAAEYATCTEHGWEPNPLCIGCRTPNIPNGEIVEGEKEHYGRYSTVKYRCREGFTPAKPVQIQCDYHLRWTGIKPCTEIPVVETPSTDEISSTDKTSCPEVENGFVVQSRNGKTKYYFSCNTGFKPFQSNWWEPVTCRSGSWSKDLTCIPQNKCGAFPSGFQTEQTNIVRMYSHEDTVAVECGPGYRSGQKIMTCVNGIWDAPNCEHVKCGSPPRVFNAVIASDPQDLYLSKSKVTYQCQTSFRITGEETISCLDGEWETPPTCESEA